MNDRRLAVACVGTLLALAGVQLAHQIGATEAYFTASQPGSIAATLATPSPTPTPTPTPTLPATTCPINLFLYGKVGASSYPMLSVRVWTNAALPAGCSRSFSLNAYTTQGPTWPTTGTQQLFDHQSVTLDADHTSGLLTVAKPPCFGQTDFYTGTIRFDGTDGPLPHYPDTNVPQPLLAWSNGGQACDTSGLGSPGGNATSTASPDPSTAPSPSDSANPGQSAGPSDSPAPSATASSSAIPTDTPTASDSPAPTATPTPSPSATPSTAPSPSDSPSPSPSATPTPSPSPDPTPSPPSLATPAPTPSPTDTPSPSATPAS